MARMVSNTNLLVTAWAEDDLVGVARSVTDFAFCCYLSDLAVDRAFQRQGIGKHLIDLTRRALPATAKVILLSAPDASKYYPHIGMQQHPSAWIIPARD